MTSKKLSHANVPFCRPGAEKPVPENTECCAPRGPVAEAGLPEDAGEGAGQCVHTPHCLRAGVLQLVHRHAVASCSTIGGFHSGSGK
jgi:hypothetical protein